MKDYKKFRWFLTSSGKLVVGGKSAEQNDLLLSRFKRASKERIVMHTSMPGSPFCVIIAEVKDVSKKDLSECAGFCGCFSRGWNKGLRKMNVHVFKLSQVSKSAKMKVGTWGVRGKVKNMKVDMGLWLVKQRRVYRAVPFGDGVCVRPGRVDKTKMVGKLREALGDEKVSSDELLSALPAGGVRIG